MPSQISQNNKDERFNILTWKFEKVGRAPLATACGRLKGQRSDVLVGENRRIRDGAFHRVTGIATTREVRQATLFDLNEMKMWEKIRFKWQNNSNGKTFAMVKPLNIIKSPIIDTVIFICCIYKTVFNC